jgi:hypothetical protein
MRMPQTSLAKASMTFRGARLHAYAHICACHRLLVVDPLKDV